MICKKCGENNPNDSKFCVKCGSSLENLTNDTGSSSATIEKKDSVLKNNGAIVDKFKALSKNAKLGIVGGAVALIVIIALLITNGNTIDLNKYLITETNGYEGYGTATANIDWQAIDAKYGSKLSFTSKAKEEYGGLLGLMTPMDALKNSVSVKLSNYSGLSNGDDVSYSWVVDETLSKYLNCKTKYSDGSFKASGLSEVGTFDAFENMSVEFTGIAPDGKASINYTGSEMNYYDFEIDNSSNLSNGDTVSVTIPEDRLTYYAEKLGKVPASLTKEFKVEGLDKYLTNISEIDDASLDEMKSQATDVFNAYVAKSFDDDEKLEDFTYLGNYLLTQKSSNYWNSYNYLTLVYKAKVHNSVSNDKGDSYDKVNDLYWYITYNNLKVDPDGKIVVDTTHSTTPNNSFKSFKIDSGVDAGWYTKTWDYYGYSTLDELYKDVVTSNIDSFNHEDNVKE